MILKETLREIVKHQRKFLKDTGIRRDLLEDVDIKSSHTIILTGIRRSGKSTLLKQLMKKIKKFYYFNFEDQRASEFELRDFEKLDEIFKEEFGESKYYFLDEIQNVEGWERFVRGKQDEKKKFFITGSNASLLSKELGTKLTGRHISYEVFPFSYSEMLRLKDLKFSMGSFKEYFKSGGFPEFLKYEKEEMLQELFNDIIARDVVVRNNLRETKTVKQAGLYLISNVGKEFSYNKLAKAFSLSVNTIISYISYFEDSYLLFTVPRFSYSYKKQQIWPKKVYSIDVGLSDINSVSFSEDKGRILENLVFLYLRRKFKDIFYFKEEGECDFIVKEKDKVKKAIQVCYELNEENKDREINGLKEAIKKLKIEKGILVTFNQKDKIDGIELVPFLEWI